MAFNPKVIECRNLKTHVAILRTLHSFLSNGKLELGPIQSVQQHLEMDRCVQADMIEFQKPSYHIGVKDERHSNRDSKKAMVK